VPTVILYLSLHEGGPPEEAEWAAIEAWDWEGSRVSERVAADFEEDDNCLVAPSPRPSVRATRECSGRWALFATETDVVPWMSCTLRTAVPSGGMLEFPIDGIGFPGPATATRVP
jgi:hypothetical protein